MIPVIRTYLLYLYLETVLITAGPASQYRIQVSNTFTVNVISCPSKQILGSLKNISRNRNEPRNIQRCQTQRSYTQITVEIMQTYDLLNGSNFAL